MSKKKGPGFFDKMKSLFKKGDKGSVPPPDESFEEEQQETLLESITDEDDLHQHLDFDHDDDELDEDFVVTEMRATPPPAPTLDNDKTDSNILSFEQQDKTQSDVDAPDDMPDIPETPPSTPVAARSGGSSASELPIGHGSSGGRIAVENFPRVESPAVFSMQGRSPARRLNFQALCCPYPALPACESSHHC